MKTLSAITCLIFCGCSHKAIIVQPIAPAAAKAAAMARDLSAHSRRLTESTVLTASASVALGFQISQAMTESDRQRNDASIPAAVAEANFQTLSRIAAAALDVERRAKSATVLAAAHEDRAAAVAVLTGEVSDAAVESDKTAAALKTTVEKQAGNAALGRVMKGIAGLALIGGLLFAALKFIPHL